MQNDIIREKVEDGEICLHYWIEKGNIDSFLIEHRAEQDPRTKPGVITGKGDKLIAIVKLIDEIKRRHPNMAIQ